MIHEPFQKSESFNERVLTTTPFTLVRLYFLHCPHLHPTRLRSANSHGGRVPHYQHEQQWKSPLVLIFHLPKLQLGLSFAPEICPVFLFFSFCFFSEIFFQFRRWTPQPPSSSGRAPPGLASAGVQPSGCSGSWGSRRARCRCRRTPRSRRPSSRP